MEGYCSAYVYWYLKRFYGLMGDNDKRSPVGEGEIAKNGYIMAHYAQYATGTTRIKAVTNNTGICATAYINETGNEVTVVLLEFHRSHPVYRNTVGRNEACKCQVETNENKKYGSYQY